MPGVNPTSPIRLPAGQRQSRPHVLLLARYGVLGASSRVRHYAQLSHLKQRGFTFEAHYLIDDEDIRRFYAGRTRRWDRIAWRYGQRLALVPQLPKFDLIWIEKEALPGLGWELECLFYRRNNTIVDFDDLWPNRYLQGDHVKSSRKLRRVLHAATAVTAANSQLATALEHASGHRPTVIPNVIDVERFRRAANDCNNGNQPICIGWIGTPLTAAKYLPAIAKTLNRLASEGITKTRLIGAGDAVPNLLAERLLWTPGGEASAVASIDIGIMPLGHSAFDACKSGWKILQYMASSRPVVATRVGHNTELINDGIDGFLVDNDEEWERRLRQLASDRALRASMGGAGLAKVAQHFDRQIGVDALERLMLSVLPPRYPPRETSR